jgi:hypothetical protein
MAKVVYNKCFGGFGLSEKALKRYAEIKGITLYPEVDPKFLTITTWWTVPPEERTGIITGDWSLHSKEERISSNARHKALTIYDRDIDREDPALVQVIEELGDEASGQCANLKIAEIQDGVLYRIDEYDGNESVQTRDDYEWKVAGLARLVKS